MLVDDDDVAAWWTLTPTIFSLVVSMPVGPHSVLDTPPPTFASFSSSSSTATKSSGLYLLPTRKSTWWAMVPMSAMSTLLVTTLQKVFEIPFDRTGQPRFAHWMRQHTVDHYPYRHHCEWCLSYFPSPRLKRSAGAVPPPQVNDRACCDLTDASRINDAKSLVSFWFWTSLPPQLSLVHHIIMLVWKLRSIVVHSEVETMHDKISLNVMTTFDTHCEGTFPLPNIDIDYPADVMVAE